MNDTQKPPERREMYTEIAALVGSIAKALNMKEAEIVAALESQAMTLKFGADANGNRFVAVIHGEQRARVYQGAIERESAADGLAGA